MQKVTGLGVGRPVGKQGRLTESGKQVPAQVRANSVRGDAVTTTEKLGVLCLCYGRSQGEQSLQGLELGGVKVKQAEC